MSFFNPELYLAKAPDKLFEISDAAEDGPHTVSFTADKGVVYERLLSQGLIDQTYLLDLARAKFPPLSPKILKLEGSFSQFINKETHYSFYVSPAIIKEVSEVLLKGVKSDSSELLAIDQFLRFINGKTFETSTSFRKILNSYLADKNSLKPDAIQVYAGFFLYVFCQSEDSFDSLLKEFFELNGISVQGKIVPPRWHKRSEMDIKFFLKQKDEELFRQNDVFLTAFVKSFGIKTKEEFLPYFRILFSCFLNKSSKSYPNTVIGEKEHQLDILFVNQQKYLFATDQIAFSLLAKSNNPFDNPEDILDYSHAALHYPSPEKLFQALINLYLEVDHIEGPVNDKVVPRVISRMSMGVFFPRKELSNLVATTFRGRTYTELFLDYHENHHDGKSNRLLGFILNAFLCLRRINLTSTSAPIICSTLKEKINPADLTHQGLKFLWDAINSKGFGDDLEEILFWMAFLEKDCIVTIAHYNAEKFFKVFFEQRITLFVPFRPLEDVLLKASLKQKNEWEDLFSECLEEETYQASSSIIDFYDESKLIETARQICFQKTLANFDRRIIKKLFLLSGSTSLASFVKNNLAFSDYKINFALFFYDELNFKDFLVNLTQAEISLNFYEIVFKLFSLNPGLALNQVTEWFKQNYLNDDHLHYCYKFYKGSFENWKLFYDFTIHIASLLNERGKSGFMYAIENFISSSLEIDISLGSDLLLHSYKTAQISLKDTQLRLAAHLENNLQHLQVFPLKYYKNYMLLNWNEGLIYFENIFKQNHNFFDLFCKSNISDSINFLLEITEFNVVLCDRLFRQVIFPLKTSEIELLTVIFEKYLSMNRSRANFLKFKEILANLLKENFKKGLELYGKVFNDAALSTKDIFEISQAGWKLISCSFEKMHKFLELILKHLKEHEIFYSLKGEEQIKVCLHSKLNPKINIEIHIEPAHFEENFRFLISLISKHSGKQAVEIVLKALNENLPCSKTAISLLKNCRETLSDQEDLYHQFITALLNQKKIENLFFESQRSLLKDLLNKNLVKGLVFLRKALGTGQISKKTCNHLLLEFINDSNKKQRPQDFYTLLLEGNEGAEQNEIYNNLLQIFKKQEERYIEFCKDENLAISFWNKCIEGSLFDLKLFETFLAVLTLSDAHIQDFFLLIKNAVRLGLFQQRIGAGYNLDKYAEIFNQMYSLGFSFALELIENLLNLKLLTRKKINTIIHQGGLLLEEGNLNRDQFLSYLDFLKWCADQKFSLSYDIIVDRLVKNFSEFSFFQNHLKEIISIVNITKSFSNEISVHLEKILNVKDHLQDKNIEEFLAFSSILSTPTYHKLFDKLMGLCIRDEKKQFMNDLIHNLFQLNRASCLSELGVSEVKKYFNNEELENIKFDAEKVLFNPQILFIYKNAIDEYFGFIFKCFFKNVLLPEKIFLFIEFLKKNKINTCGDQLGDFVMKFCINGKIESFNQSIREKILEAVFDYYKRWDLYPEILKLSVQLTEAEQNLPKDIKLIFEAINKISIKVIPEEQVATYIKLLKNLKNLTVSENFVKTYSKLLGFYFKDLELLKKINEFVLFIDRCQSAIPFYKFFELNEGLIREFKQIYEELKSLENCQILDEFSLLLIKMRNYLFKDLSKQPKKISDSAETSITWMISNTAQEASKNLDILKHYNIRHLYALKFALFRLDPKSLNIDLLLKYKTVFDTNFILGNSQQKHFYDDLNDCLSLLIDIPVFNEESLKIVLKGLNSFSLITETVSDPSLLLKKLRSTRFNDLISKLDIGLIKAAFLSASVENMGQTGYFHFTLSLIAKSHELIAYNKNEALYSLACQKLITLLNEIRIDKESEERIFGRGSLLEKIFIQRSLFSNKGDYHFDKLLEGIFRLKFPSLNELFKVINFYYLPNKLNQISKKVCNFLAVQNLNNPSDVEKSVEIFLSKLLTAKMYDELRYWLNNYKLLFDFPLLYSKMHLTLLNITKQEIDFQACLGHFEIVLLDHLDNPSILELWGKLLNVFEDFTYKDKNSSASSTRLFFHLFEILIKGSFGYKIQNTVNLNFHQLQVTLPIQVVLQNRMSTDTEVLENMLDDLPLYFTKTLVLHTKRNIDSIPKYTAYFWFLLESLSKYISAFYVRLPAIFFINEENLDEDKFKFDQAFFNNNVFLILSRINKHQANLHHKIVKLLHHLSYAKIAEKGYVHHLLMLYKQALLHYLIQSKVSKNHLEDLIQEICFSSPVLNIETTLHYPLHLDSLADLISKIVPPNYPRFFCNYIELDFKLFEDVKKKRITVDEQKILEKSKAFFMKLLKEDVRNYQFLLDYLENYLPVLQKNPPLLNCLINEIMKYLFSQEAFYNSKPLYLFLGEEIIARLENLAFQEVYLLFWTHLMRFCALHVKDPAHRVFANFILNKWSACGLLSQLKGSSLFEFLELMLPSFNLYHKTAEQAKNQLDWKGFWSPLTKKLSKSDYVLFEKNIQGFQ